jgi:hypothetical protein
MIDIIGVCVKLKIMYIKLIFQTTCILYMYNILAPSGFSVSFDLWRKEAKLAWEAHNVWVQVHDLPPHALDDFLSLLSLRNLFGKQEILI